MGKKVKTPVGLDGGEAYSYAQGLNTVLVTAEWNTFSGPFQFGGALWTVATLLGDANLPVNAYKSTDNGNTWTAIDSAGAILAVNNLPRSISVSMDGSSLYVLYMDGQVGTAAAGLRIRAFNMTSGLWGADTPVIPNTDYPGTNANSVTLFALATSGGVSNVVFTRDNTVMAVRSFACATVQYDGVSAWGSETAFGAELVNPVITGVTVSATGAMHVFYSRFQRSGAAALSPNPVDHVEVSAAGSVSAADVVIADAVQTMSANNFSTYPSFDPGAVVGSDVYVPYGRNQGISNSSVIPAMLKGSTGGSWTSVDLADYQDRIVSTTGISCAAFYNAPWVYLLWLVFDPFDPTNGLLQYTRTQDGVTFDAILNLWDPAVNPPPFDPIGAATVLSAAWLTDQRLIGVLFNIDTQDFAHFYRVFLSNGPFVPLPIPPGPPPTGGSPSRRRPVCPVDYIRQFMRERHHDYILEIPSLPAGEALLSQPLLIDTDSPFLGRARGLHLAPLAETRSQSPQVESMRFRYKNAAGEYLAPIGIQTPQDFWSAFGNGGNYRPIYPQQPYPPGSVIEVDIWNDGEEDITNLQVIFRGVKLFKDGAIASPTYPARCRPLDFTYLTGKGTPTDPALIMATTSELRQQVLNIKSDADFALRGGQAGNWTSSGADGVYSPFGYTELYIQLKDANLKPYSNVPIHIDWLFGNAGGSDLPADKQLGNAAPGLLVPEIYLEKNSVLYFDLFRRDSAYTGVTDSLPVRLSMAWIGTKIFGGGQ